MIKKYILFFIIAFTGAGLQNLSAQQCATTLTTSYASGSGGVWTFTVFPNTPGNYSWAFGNNTFTSNPNMNVASCTYTANGIYTAFCTFTNPALSCTATSSPMTVTVTNACALSFTVIPPNPPNACNGTISVGNLGQCASTSYTWSNFSLGSSISGVCQGSTYTVTSNSPFNCCPSLTGAVTVPSCALVTSFNSNTLSAGQVSFNSTSTGTTANTTYTWNFGDGNFSYGTTAITHTYSNNGTYTVSLSASNSTNNCAGISYSMINVNSINTCSLNASFSYTTGPGNSMVFNNTSTGTTTNSTYLWNFGDGTSMPGANVSHTYSANGIYSVQLAVNNNTVCSDTVGTLITVTNVPLPCTLTANYTHTVLPSGLVNFSSSSTGTTANSSYYWNFGDGVYSTAPSPSHNYIYNGSYVVSLIVTRDPLCVDTTEANVNITGLSCVANAIFNLSPGNQPQYWNAVPIYPWNVTTASWDWGDGSSSNALYTSHTYSAPGNYNICLTITVSCGTNGAYCSYSNIYRSEEINGQQGMVYVNTKMPGITNGVSASTGDAMHCMIYPNPSSGKFDFMASGLNAGPVNITIYNPVGETVYQNTLETSGGEIYTQINMPEIAEGIYLMKLIHNEKGITKRIIITR